MASVVLYLLFRPHSGENDHEPVLCDGGVGRGGAGCLWAGLGRRGSELIPESTAARHGLSRTWFTQVQLDPARTRICSTTLDGGTLFVQTNRAMLQATDAETGQTLWARQIGNPQHPSMTLGLNRKLLVMLNGTRFYAWIATTASCCFKPRCAAFRAQGRPSAAAWLMCR